MKIFDILKKLIESKRHGADMADKLDIFFAAGKITTEQYMELTMMMEV